MNAPATLPAREEDDQTMKLFGVRYYAPGESAVFRAHTDQLYDFTAHVRPATPVDVERGDSVVVICGDTASWVKGPNAVPVGVDLAIVVRGYTPSGRTASLRGKTVLPYVNGCSTRQIFPPERAGDPTLQLLDIPPHSAEQAHHIHSTVRVVYVLSGRGRSIVGMEGKSVTTELVPGMVCILDPMCPHHFDTPQGEHLICVPFHVFSSTGAREHDHPMENGTHLMNQGA